MSREEFDKILKGFNLEVQNIATETRALVFDVLPETVEVVWEKQKIAGLGTGPKKMTEHFCWIQPCKAHVNLGFNYGAELPDPSSLLEGTGKLFRHVRIQKLEELSKPELRKLIEAATKHRVPPPKRSNT